MKTAQPKVWTEAELQTLPDDGFNFELVEGQLVMSPKNNFQHEDICAELLMAMRSYARAKGLGAVLGSNAGCWMRDRNCRAPDVSFISKARLKALGFTRSTKRFLPAAPDLAVEILSPSNTRAEIDARLKDFFASGTQLAWIIDPESERAEIYHSPSDRKFVGKAGFLEGEQLLSGFRLPLAELFQEREWE
jgi:Uma2 family endonuclease